MITLEEARIREIVSWMAGYIGVIEGHPRLKEEMLKLEKLVCIRSTKEVINSQVGDKETDQQSLPVKAGTTPDTHSQIKKEIDKDYALDKQVKV